MLILAIAFAGIVAALLIRQAPGQAVSFPDSNLESAIRQALGRPDGEIQRSDLAGLTQLDAIRKDIVNLSGLEHCTGLQSLNLVGNRVSDLTPLSGLGNLTRLLLGYNSITDITPLGGLASLRELSLVSNEIVDITPLAGLTNLAELALQGNQIADITPLAGLTNLKWLFLGSNRITDIQPLVANPGLSAGDHVDLGDNPLSNLSINTYIPQLQERGVIILSNPSPVAALLVLGLVLYRKRGPS